MEEFIQQLTELLQQQFPGCKVELEPADSDRAGGFLIWDGFDGVEQIARQQKLWAILRSRLSVEQQRHLSVILTMTPEEMAFAREG